MGFYDGQLLTIIPRGGQLLMQRILIILGLLIASIGILYPYLKQLGLGRLPGDIVLRGENSAFYL